MNQKKAKNASAVHLGKLSAESRKAGGHDSEYYKKLVRKRRKNPVKIQNDDQIS